MNFIKVWRVFSIDERFSNVAILARLKMLGFCVSDLAERMIATITLPQNFLTFTYGIVAMSGSQLGFTKPVAFADILKKAADLGLGICPDRLGPRFRMLYIEQSRYKWYLVAMNPITVDNLPFIFSIGCVPGKRVPEKWLSAVSMLPDSLWPPDYVWIFVKTKRSRK